MHAFTIPSGLEHLVREVRGCKTDFLRFRFDGQAGLTTGTEIVLETGLVQAAEPEILQVGDSSCN